LARRVAGHLRPGLVEHGVGLAIRRHQPHPGACELLQPEIGARVEPQHVHVIGDLRE